MTDHLATHEAEVKEEPRRMKGAQARVVNSSSSGPRVLDEETFNAVLGRLRPLMGKRAFAKTTTAMKQLLTHVTASVGRSDIVNLSPHAEFVAFLDSAMA